MLNNYKDDTLFQVAVSHILGDEGGYNDLKEDKGGATNCGISLAFLKTVEPGATKADIRNMTREKACELYYVHFWLRYGMARFQLSLAIMLFEITVNTGSWKTAVVLLQRAIRAASKAQLDDDGQYGAQTHAAMLSCDMSNLLAAMRSEQAGYYRLIVTKNPSQSKFIKGWLNRAYS